MTAYPEKQTAITGIGQSKISRGADKSALGLTIDATLQAIENAGLKRSDIDGMACWPGGTGEANGFAPVSIPVLQDALRLKLNWYSNASETSGQFGALFNAIGAIAAGLARHVIVYRTMYEATARKTSFANALSKPGERVYGIFNWYAPYHVYAAALQQALFFNRYVHDSGIRPEHVAQIAINGRRNAALNPAAVYRTPITLDDYMASPVIATPLRLFDCDVPIDGATAIILSHRDAARDLPNPLTWIEAVGSSMHYRNNWVQLDALATQAQPKVAEMMWNRTDLTIKDVDVAELYDGFSYHTINWLENLGVCGRFEAKDFIDGGHRIALDGEFPINTNGGALSAGRMHAYGQVHEACTQLWGLGGDRQVGGRRGRDGPKVAVLTTAGGPLAGSFLLARE
ncbi:thiolase family protein [Sphingomonas lacunae]|uniref:Thiolase family protein n=1 Tax=Sphingomonas lacunae TaxID=2698828 RepID=A0A6M4ASZ3_9SPHN|nr:thiolase family protein [Sphingomonas lacunae]QJQ31442.1 thiolase family protein [Sphingomonas lacunae]